MLPAEPADRSALALELLACAQALTAMQRGQRLAGAISAQVQRLALAPRSRAAVQDICFSTARRLGWADALAGLLNRKPPAEPLYSLQRAALVLLDAALANGADADQRHPAVIVDQTVHAARLALPGGAAQAGFLNATLRRFLRERAALGAQLAGNRLAEFNLPPWWLQQLQADHPGHWEAIVRAGDSPAPLTLRVNRRQIERDAYLARLAAVGLTGRPLGLDGVLLAKSVEITGLPGYAQGWFSVQDGGAQLAAPLLDLADGQRVLDACAAPGGKTAHMLELADLSLLALDLQPERLARVAQNLQRLRLQARLQAADAARPAQWWDGEPFDRILLDAPCSASGIVRRHPDIRWLRKRGEIATLCRLQRTLLDALWPLLKPGGKLLYATCSVFRAEGEHLVAAFESVHPDCSSHSLYWNWTTGMSLTASQVPSSDPADVEPLAHLLPTNAARLPATSGPAALPMRDHDGFHYALLEKKA